MRYSYNTTVATSGAGTATFPHHQSSSRVFSGFRVTQSLVFFKVLCRSLFFFFLLAIVLSILHRFYLSFIFWPLYCLSFTDSICLFSFGPCVVHPSLIYGFSLPLWHLQAFLAVAVKSHLLSRFCVIFKYH